MRTERDKAMKMMSLVVKLNITTPMKVEYGVGTMSFGRWVGYRACSWGGNRSPVVESCLNEDTSDYKRWGPSMAENFR